MVDSSDRVLVGVAARREETTHQSREKRMKRLAMTKKEGGTARAKTTGGSVK